MKNLADFKKRLALGVEIHTVCHTAFLGRDEKGVAQFGDKDKGVRPVSIKQTNSFALATVTEKDGKPEIVDSWCGYPKASELRINNENSVTILEEDCNHNSPTYKQLIPCLTYTFI